VYSKEEDDGWLSMWSVR